MILCIALLILSVSVYESFKITREYIIDGTLRSRYDIQEILSATIIGKKVNPKDKIFSKYEIDDGLDDVIELVYNGINIKIKEVPNTERTPFLPFMSNPSHDEVLDLHIFTNEKEISSPDTMIVKAGESFESRYFSWIDVISVYDNKQHTEQIVIIQRLPHVSGSWKAITLNDNGQLEKEVQFTYEERHHYSKELYLVNSTSTRLMDMGYYTNVTRGYDYPHIIYPIIYPVFSGTVGLLLMLSSIVNIRTSRKKMK